MQYRCTGWYYSNKGCHAPLEIECDDLYYFQGGGVPDTWNIDFFFDCGSLYFAMAECEMVGVYGREPEEILHLVSQHIIYEVPKNRYFDFTSSKLSDVSCAKNQLTFLQNSI